MDDEDGKTPPTSRSAKVAGAIAGAHALAGALLLLYLAISPNIGGGGDPGSHVGDVMGFVVLVAGPLWIFGSILSLMVRPWNVGLALLACNQAPLLWLPILMSA